MQQKHNKEQQIAKHKKLSEDLKYEPKRNIIKKI